MLKVGIDTAFAARNQPFDQYLKWAQGLRAESFEFSWGPGAYGGSVRLDAEGAKEIRKKVDAAGLEIAAVHAVNVATREDFVEPDPAQMKLKVDTLKAKIDFAVALGCNVVSMYAGEPREGLAEDECLALMVKGLGQCAEYAAEKGVYLAMQNHGMLCNRADFQFRIMEGVGSDYLRLNLDNSNYRWFGADLDTVKRYVEMVAPYVVHTHVKDGTAAGGFQKKYEHVPLGEGEMDLAHLVRSLVKAGYRRPLTMQYDPSHVGTDLKVREEEIYIEVEAASFTQGVAYLKGLQRGLEAAQAGT